METGKYILALAAVVALQACLGEVDMATVGDEADVSENESGTVVSVSSSDANFNAAATSDPGDYYRIDSAWLDEVDLVVRVEYSGGCENHHFTMISPHLQGEPTQRVRAILHHDAQSDRCEALVREDLRWDVLSLMPHRTMVPGQQLTIINPHNSERNVLLELHSGDD